MAIERPDFFGTCMVYHYIYVPHFGAISVSPRGLGLAALWPTRSGKNKSITTGWVNLIDEKDMPRLTPWEFQLAHIMRLGRQGTERNGTEVIAGWKAGEEEFGGNSTPGEKTWKIMEALEASQKVDGNDVFHRFTHKFYVRIRNATMEDLVDFTFTKMDKLISKLMAHTVPETTGLNNPSWGILHWNTHWYDHYIYSIYNIYTYNI